MDFRDNRNLVIGILLSLLSCMMTAAMFLAYKIIIAEAINNDLNRENLQLYKEKKELIRKLEM